MRRQKLVYRPIERNKTGGIIKGSSDKHSRMFIFYYEHQGYHNVHDQQRYNKNVAFSHKKLQWGLSRTKVYVMVQLNFEAIYFQIVIVN